MKHLRIGARILLLLLVTVSGLLGATGADRALAQGGATSFVSPMTGIPIAASGPWTIDTTSVLSQDGIESVTLEGEFEFMQVWFMPGNVDLVEARDVVLDSFAQTFGTFVEIDRGAYGNVSYSLDITSSEGIEFGVFSLFLGQRDSGYVEYYVYFGALSLFAQGFASAQQNVTVNGTGVFGGVDGVGLQNLLLANAGVTGASPSTTTQAPPVPTSQPAQPTPPAQPAQPTPPPATEGGPASNDGAAYLQALQGETAYLQTTITDFMNNYMLMDSNAEAAVPELDRVAGEWRSYPQRAAGIVAPAGFETIDASYRAIVTEAEALAVLWDGAIQSAQAQDGTTGTKLVDLVLRVMGFQTMIDDLNTAISTSSGAATTTTTEQPTQAPVDSPTQAPTEAPSQPTGGVTGEQMAYIQTVRSEISMLETSMDDFQADFTAYLDGTAPDPDLAIQEINAAIDMWAAYPDTAATIVAPAGMEEVGTAYQTIATGMSTAAGTFSSAIQAGADGDQATSQTLMQEFIDQLEALYAQINDLNALLDGYEQGGTASQPTAAPAQPTAEAQPTQETTTITTDTGDGDAYAASISGETQAIMDSIVSFAEGVQLLGSTDTAEQEQGVAQVNGAVEYWATYDQVAAGIVAPAGFEDVDAAYQQLATDVAGLATLFDAWINAPDASQAAAAEEFSAALDSVQAQIQELDAMVGGGSTGSTTTTTTSDPQDQPTDITETGNRGQLPQLPSQGDEPQDTGSANVEELGLVSETEYVSPQFDIEVVWDDRWAFGGDVIEDAIGSDEENGEDWIVLAWTGGDTGDITIAVSETEDFAPDQMVAYWESDEFIDQLGAPGEVLLSEASDDRGGALILVDDGGEGAVVYKEAVCLSRACDQVAFITVISPVVDAADLIADAEEGIEIDGEAATGVFSTRQINRALDQ